MLRKTVALSVAALFVAGAAFAAPDKGKKKDKVTHVTTCPMTGKDAKESTQTKEVTLDGKKYMVHFCCGGCPEGFDKLSASEQKAKIKAALKPAKKSGKKTSAVPAKLTAVNICPMTGEKVVGAGGGSSVVGNYEVHFCCAGCKPQFDKMTASEKDTKIKAALAK